MKIINEAELRKCREKTRCEYCQKPLRHQAEPHHIFAKGFGSGSRLDHPWNLIALGGPWDCQCHTRFHSGEIMRCDLLAVIAAREGKLQGEIETELYRLIRTSRKDVG